MLYALIPLLPLLAFIVLGLAGHVLKDRAHLIAVPAVGLSFLLSVLAFSEVAGGRVLEIPCIPGGLPAISPSGWGSTWTS